MISPVKQDKNQRGEILSQFTEHLRSVLPAEVGEGATHLTLPKLYEDCFVRANGKVGWTDQATHSIDTGSSRPVKQPPWCTSFEEKEVIERQLSELLLEGKIQASESPWTSPVLLIKKKDGS